MSQEVKDAILKVLPSLAAETLALLLDKLDSIGVEVTSDLQYVKEEDLTEHLRPIDCRKLLGAWRTDGTYLSVPFVCLGTREPCV